ncbi:Pycsar system effector family protein [Cedecea sp. S5-13]|uniref:Pycsar system effector family protein n=1 Tax=Cedecea selenatireducens TaxID=3144416 RepID=UPI0035CD0708
MIKVVTRTDGFHNYANTKSTVILSFTTALLALIIANLENCYTILNSSHIPHVRFVFTILIFSVFSLLFAALYFISKTIIPNTDKSRTKNIYSFIDIYSNLTEDEYKSEVASARKNELVISMCDLQYNLSNSLNKKYFYHKRAVVCLTNVLLIIVMLSLILIFK